MRQSPSRDPASLHNSLTGQGPGLRAPALPVRETEAPTQDRKQSRSKLQVDTVARGGYGEFTALPTPCVTLASFFPRIPPKLPPAENGPW